MEEDGWIIDDFLIGLHQLGKKEETEDKKDKDENQEKKAT